jgi:aromatic-L-amino-acid decarboxylase
MTYKLEPSSEEVRQMLALTTNKIVEFLEHIGDPVKFDAHQSGKDAFQHSENLPEIEKSLKEILDDVFENKISNALPTTHPGFMAYIPGGGIFHAGLAELIAKISNRYISIDATAPFLSQIEIDVLKWFCEMVGFPETSGGTLTSGGSIANLTAVICARTLIMGDDFFKGRVYASEFVHHSMWKAFHAAGIPASNIRSIPIDLEFKLDVKKLEQTIKEDIKKGFTPLMVVANAGSTNTGTIDALDLIADITKKFNMWLHVDAAYGGFFSMLKEGKKRLKGIELADSITLDPHKGLFLPYGTGAFIVRDREKLKRVFSHDADYIPSTSAQQDYWNFSEMSLELTRPFRGLGVWLPFKMLGANVFKETLNEKLELANYFHEKISQSGRWQIVAAPELTITVFKYSNESLSLVELNKINQSVLEYVNDKGRANLSGTIINDYFVIRCCVLSFRTHQLHLDHLLGDLDEGLSRFV